MRLICAGALALLLNSIVGCVGARSARQSASQAALENLGLEVAATTEDQAREDVLSAPTSFEVSLEDDMYCWERARFFLENYSSEHAGSHASAVTKIVGTTWALVSNPGQSRYTYEVSKDSSQAGYRYRVSCSAGEGGDSVQASLNAGNFARFIRDGKLEMSLLHPRS